MTERIRVAEFKRRFAELVAQVRYRGARFVIVRREQPMAALVSVEDLRYLERESALPHEASAPGLLSAIGAWDEYDDLDRVIGEIYQARESALDRPVHLPS